jgi:hypothetical protein
MSDELCNHNTSVMVGEIGPYQMHQCTWQCQDVLISRVRPDGVTEEWAVGKLFEYANAALESAS